jgi:hypothetical protein
VHFVQIGTKALVILPCEVLLLLLLVNSVAFNTSSNDVVEGANSVWRWELDNRGHGSDSEDTEGSGGNRGVEDSEEVLKEDRWLEKTVCKRIR